MRKISVFAVSCATVLLLSACGSSSSSVPASSVTSPTASNSLEPTSSVAVSSSAPVNVFMQDDHAMDTGVSFAVPALALNGLLRLMTAAAVAVVGNKPLAAGWLFLHRDTTFAERQCGALHGIEQVNHFLGKVVGLHKNHAFVSISRE